MARPPFNNETHAGRNNPFLDQVKWVGYGKRPWSRHIRAKRKFARGGRFREWQDNQGITVEWEEMPAWNVSPIKEDGGGGHYGMLCIIAQIGDKWYAWNIEHLRKSTERTGTSSVNTNGWDGPLDWIDLVFNYKAYSPVKGKGYYPNDGDWFGLMIVPHPDAKPKSQDVRTDILPLQFEVVNEDEPDIPDEPDVPDTIDPRFDAISEACLEIAAILVQLSEEIDE